MCNLSELIFERAWEAGWEQGREETRILILQMFLENGGAEEEAERIFEATPEELEKARLQMVQSGQLAGKTKAVGIA